MRLMRQLIFPYALMRNNDGSFTAVNRLYKPLGFDASEHVNYSDYPINHKFKGVGEATLRKLAWNGNIEGNIMLYSDACAPFANDKDTKAYLKRLEILAKLKVIS